MTSQTVIISSGGIGDQILAFQSGAYVQNPKIICLARDEVFEILQFLFSDKFDLSQHPEKEKWGENYWIESNWGVVKAAYPEAEEIYYVTPDLLYRNPHAFDYVKYKTHPQIIRQKRLLEHLRVPEKIIYVALNSTTPEYKYQKVHEVLYQLATALPDYQIYFNRITKWAGIEVSDNVRTGELPVNCFVAENESFINSLQFLKRSEYCVCVDNGISHLAHGLGLPRLLLDCRLGQESVAWVSRWREDSSESVPQSATPELISWIVANNIRIPQTTLIPRFSLPLYGQQNPAKYLMFKF